MAKFENVNVADAFQCFDVGQIVVGIVAEFLHQGLVNRFSVGREYVGQRTISGIANSLFSVADDMLVGRPAERAAQLRANGLVVVSCPGVIHASFCNSEGPRGHRYG